MQKELRSFMETGQVKLPGVLNLDAIANTKKTLWSEIQAHFGISPDDPITWKIDGLPLGSDKRSQRLSGMNPVMRKLGESPHLKTLERELQANMDRIFGTNLFQPLNLWYSLLSFPGTSKEWTLPHNSWHSDLPNVVGDSYPWSIFTFVFLDKVDRATGPTLMVAGSHRSGQIIAEDAGVFDPNTIKAFEDLNHDLVSAPNTTKLLPVGRLLPSLVERHQWFRDLVKGEHSSTENVPHQIQELTGSLGEAVVFDPRCLHTYSPNVSDRPRQVIRLDFKRMPR